MSNGEVPTGAGTPVDGQEDAVELEPAIQAVLGHHLKAHYDDLVQAPIPDTILLLLAQLEAKETGAGR